MAEVNAVEKQPVTQEYLKKIGRLLACGKLSWSSTVIFTGQPVITRAVDDGSYKEKGSSDTGEPFRDRTLYTFI
mgnify:CR=1 FL=1